MNIATAWSLLSSVSHHCARADVLAKEPREWLRWLGVGALGLVIVQGVLGGLRVVLLQHTLAIIHACTAQAFFALTVSLALFSSDRMANAPASEKPITDGGRCAGWRRSPRA